LFSEIAFDIALERGLLGTSAHIDTTSFSLHGAYTSQDTHITDASVDAADTSDVHPAPVKITHGYSKDHRPDLKQVILSLTVTGDAQIPIWMEPQNGNASDKKSFQETVARIRAFQKQIKNAPEFLWIGDSAFYVPDKLLACQDMRWITRVPETVGNCRTLVSMNDVVFSWNDAGNGYRYTELGSTYGEIHQRWILVSSEQAYKREKTTFLKKLETQDKAVKTACWHFGNQIFGCANDAQAALAQLKRKYPYHQIDADVVEERKHKRRGRPSSGDCPEVVGYRINASPRRDENACNVYLQRKGRFILATNDLNDESLSPQKILEEYKAQQNVEGGFRFLKDPWFMIDSFFLKSTRRIEALMMVMTLCLLVYNIAQFSFRKAMADAKKTVPNQIGKHVSNPTMRWIFQIMEGISVVAIRDITTQCTRRATTNIDPLRRQIIQLFGKTACLIYGIPQEIAGM
jgi:transposase